MSEPLPDWTDPKTWTVGELVRASDLNAQVRDNITVLLALAGTPISAVADGEGFRSTNTWGPLDDVAGPSVRFMAGPTGKVSVSIHARMRTIDVNFDRALASWTITRESDSAVVQAADDQRGLLARIRGAVTVTYPPRLVNLQPFEVYTATMVYMARADDALGDVPGQMAAGSRIIQVNGALPAPA